MQSWLACLLDMNRKTRRRSSSRIKMAINQNAFCASGRLHTFVKFPILWGLKLILNWSREFISPPAPPEPHPPAIQLSTRIHSRPSFARGAPRAIFTRYYWHIGIWISLCTLHWIVGWLPASLWTIHRLQGDFDRYQFDARMNGGMLNCSLWLTFMAVCVSIRNWNSRLLVNSELWRQESRANGLLITMT